MRFTKSLVLSLAVTFSACGSPTPDPTMPPDPTDRCATVSCSQDQICENGTCIPNQMPDPCETCTNEQVCDMQTNSCVAKPVEPDPHACDAYASFEQVEFVCDRGFNATVNVEPTTMGCEASGEKVTPQEQLFIGLIVQGMDDSQINPGHMYIIPNMLGEMVISFEVAYRVQQDFPVSRYRCHR